MVLSPFSVPLLVIWSLPVPSVMALWMVPKLSIVVCAEPVTKMP
jgi:hypothetical protein